MKKIIILLTMFAFLFSEKKIEENITYEQTQNIEFTKAIKNGARYNSYVTQNGTILNVEDTLFVGKPSIDESQHKEYIGTEKVFTYIMEGGVGMAIFGGIRYLSASSQGTMQIIKKIYVSHTKISKKSPLYVSITLKNPNVPKLASKSTISDIDKALNFGEIISPNAPMTRKEAVAKLKESKELLDLEIITQEEYDALKKDLTPIIRGK